MQGKNCSFWSMSISCLNLFIFFFVLVSPLFSFLFYNTRLEISDGLHCLPQLVQFLFFVLVFPLPSLSFSRNAHWGAFFEHGRSLFTISLCFPSALALVFSCDAICDQWAPMLASARSFLTFSLCFPSTIAQVLHTSTRSEGKQA